MRPSRGSGGPTPTPTRGVAEERVQLSRNLSQNRHISYGGAIGAESRMDKRNLVFWAPLFHRDARTRFGHKPCLVATMTTLSVI